MLETPSAYPGGALCDPFSIVDFDMEAPALPHVPFQAQSSSSMSPTTATAAAAAAAAAAKVPNATEPLSSALPYRHHIVTGEVSLSTAVAGEALSVAAAATAAAAAAAMTSSSEPVPTTQEVMAALSPGVGPAAAVTTPSPIAPLSPFLMGTSCDLGLDYCALCGQEKEESLDNYPPSPEDVRFHGQWVLRRRERLMRRLKTKPDAPDRTRKELALHLCKICLDIIPPAEMKGVLAKIMRPQVIPAADDGAVLGDGIVPDPVEERGLATEIRKDDHHMQTAPVDVASMTDMTAAGQTQGKSCLPGTGNGRGTTDARAAAELGPGYNVNDRSVANNVLTSAGVDHRLLTTYNLPPLAKTLGLDMPVPLSPVPNPIRPPQLQSKTLQPVLNEVLDNLWHVWRASEANALFAKSRRLRVAVSSLCMRTHDQLALVMSLHAELYAWCAHVRDAVLQARRLGACQAVVMAYHRTMASSTAQQEWLFEAEQSLYFESCQVTWTDLTDFVFCECVLQDRAVLEAVVAEIRVEASRFSSGRDEMGQETTPTILSPDAWLESPHLSAWSEFNRLVRETRMQYMDAIYRSSTSGLQTTSTTTTTTQSQQLNQRQQQRWQQPHPILSDADLEDPEKRAAFVRDTCAIPIHSLLPPKAAILITPPTLSCALPPRPPDVMYDPWAPVSFGKEEEGPTTHGSSCHGAAADATTDASTAAALTDVAADLPPMSHMQEPYYQHLSSHMRSAMEEPLPPMPCHVGGDALENLSNASYDYDYTAHHDGTADAADAAAGAGTYGKCPDSEYDYNGEFAPTPAPPIPLPLPHPPSFPDEPVEPPLRANRHDAASARDRLRSKYAAQQKRKQQQHRCKAGHDEGNSIAESTAVVHEEEKQAKKDTRNVDDLLMFIEGRSDPDGGTSGAATTKSARSGSSNDNRGCAIVGKGSSAGVSSSSHNNNSGSSNDGSNSSTAATGAASGTSSSKAKASNKNAAKKERRRRRKAEEKRRRAAEDANANADVTASVAASTGDICASASCSDTAGAALAGEEQDATNAVAVGVPKSLAPLAVSRFDDGSSTAKTKTAARTARTATEVSSDEEDLSFASMAFAAPENGSISSTMEEPDDEFDRELEMFKTFCNESRPAVARQKVHINMGALKASLARS